MLINSQFQFGTTLEPATQAEVKSEPMLHRACGSFAYQNGGKLTKAFLDALGFSWGDALIDSRVHMLMPGMYPCIPGWHHDDVPRERSDKQPNYENPSYKAEHCMALFGDCAPTEFAIGIHDVEIPPIGQKIYKVLSPVVENLCADGALIRHHAPENRLIFFDYQTWHRGVAAHKNGFRFFIRATRFSNLTARNEIRQNANVYMPILDEGW